jgi:hypothetical protein
MMRVMLYEAAQSMLRSKKWSIPYPARGSQPKQRQQADRFRRIGELCRLFNATTAREIDAVFVSCARAPGLALRRRRPAVCQPAGSTRQSVSAPCDCHDIGYTRSRRGRWADELRDEHSRGLSPDACLRWSHPQGSQASGLAGRPGEQVRLVVNAQTARMLDLEIPPTPVPTRCSSKSRFRLHEPADPARPLTGRYRVIKRTTYAQCEFFAS